MVALGLHCMLGVWARLVHFVFVLFMFGHGGGLRVVCETLNKAACCPSRGAAFWSACASPHGRQGPDTSAPSQWQRLLPPSPSCSEGQGACRQRLSKRQLVMVGLCSLKRCAAAQGSSAPLPTSVHRKPPLHPPCPTREAAGMAHTASWGSVAQHSLGRRSAREEAAVAQWAAALLALAQVPGPADLPGGSLKSNAPSQPPPRIRLGRGHARPLAQHAAPALRNLQGSVAAHRHRKAGVASAHLGKPRLADRDGGARVPWPRAAGEHGPPERHFPRGGGGSVEGRGRQARRLLCQPGQEGLPGGRPLSITPR